ncbi:MAG: hypothetical protein IKU90_02485 [Clostridia bacterium]|nr:hypothetical protein [Clostridia bacterium]
MALTIFVTLTACNLRPTDPTRSTETQPEKTTSEISVTDSTEAETENEDIPPTEETTDCKESASEELNHPETPTEEVEESSALEESNPCAHVSTDIPAIPATCLEAGKTEGSMCEVCGELLAAQAEIPPLGHSYDAALDFQCAACGSQAICPAPILSLENDLSLAWGETLSLSWQYAEDPLFSVVCMVKSSAPDGAPVDLWDSWRTDTGYRYPCRVDGETLTLQVYACYAVNGDPAYATQSTSALLNVTVSVREALETPVFITGNQVTTVAEKDVTVAWGAVSEEGSSVTYAVSLLSPNGEAQLLSEACDETLYTVPSALLTEEGTYTLQIIARDELETYRDSLAAVLPIHVTPPSAVDEQDFTNPARYASDYFYRYLATLDNGENLQKFYRLLDSSLSEFHRSNETAETVQVSGGTTYSYAVKLNYARLGLTLDEAASVRNLYVFDHPLYYWISSRYVYSGTSLYICIEDEYATGAARARANELVYSGVAAMAEGLNGSDSHYRIALAYYERLLARADYAFENDGSTPQDDPWAHSIIGVFDPAHNEVVCEGFAKTYSLLLNYHGVENIPVIGLSRDVGHMWNLVRMDDGQWYWCDVTWDDRTYSPLGTDYKYFCVTDTQDVLYYHLRDGMESGKNYNVSESATFMDDHSVRWDLGITLDMSQAIPARAEIPFDGVGLELRDTFTVDGMTYAKTGYGTVQLVDVGNRRNVTVPEAVTHEGITYTVTSIGLINSSGVYLTGRLIPLLASSVYIPKTVTYVWDSAVSSMRVTVTVDPDNPVYTSQNGVLKPKM